MPLATVSRLRPRPNRHTEALQGALDLGGWSEPVRTALNERLTSFLPEGIPSGWSFVMVTAEAKNMATFLEMVGSGPRPFSTLAVWNAMLPYIRRDTGEIVCGQRKLAQTAGVSLGDVPRALKRLVEMDVLIKEAKGVYRVNPAFAWRGTLAKREAAEKAAPRLQVVTNTLPQRGH